MQRFWSTFSAVALALATNGAAADWGISWNNCDETRDLALEFDLDGVTDITVEAVAGDLDIEGVRAPSRVMAEGVACARDRYGDRIDDIRLVSERDGGTLRIIADVPRARGKDSLIGYLDFSLQVPDDLPLAVFDSSGDVNIDNTGPLRVHDSSGDLDFERINGDINVDRDSSGDLSINGAGNVVIEIDSSGDIEIREALSVQIGKDSSGSIEAYDIAGDVFVGTDSSGDIDVSNVGGSFTVTRDGSGEIDYDAVAGNIQIPANKRDD